MFRQIHHRQVALSSRLALVGLLAASVGFCCIVQHAAADKGKGGSLAPGRGVGVDRFFGLEHTALGTASLSSNPDGSLRVSNIGSSGNDGVSIDLGHTTGFALRYFATDSGGSRRGGGGARIGDPFCALRPIFDAAGIPLDARLVHQDIIGGNSSVSFAHSMPDAQCVEIKLHHHGLLVDSSSRVIQSNELPELLATMNTTVCCDGRWYECFVAGTSLVQVLHLESAVLASLDGSSVGPVTCDQVSISLNGLPPGEPVIDRLVVECGNLPDGSLDVSHEVFAPGDHCPPYCTGSPSSPAVLSAVGSAYIAGIGEPDICAGCPECCNFSSADAVFHTSGVYVSNIGASGNDGVSIYCRLWGSPWFVSDLDLRCSPIHLSDNGDMLELTATGTYAGTPNHPLGQCRLLHNSGISRDFIFADYSALGSSTVTLEVYSNGSLVGSEAAAGGPGMIVGMLEAGSGGLGIKRCRKLGGGPGSPPCYAMEMSALFTLHTLGGLAYAGDELRVIASDASGSVSVTDSLTLRGAGLDPFIAAPGSNSGGSAPEPGSVVVYDGLLHGALGGATLDVQQVAGRGRKLTACCLGSSGQDGVEIRFRPAARGGGGGGGGSGKSGGAAFTFDTTMFASYSSLSIGGYDDQCPMCPDGLVVGVDLTAVSPTETSLEKKWSNGHVTLMKLYDDEEARGPLPPVTFMMIDDEALSLTISPGTQLQLHDASLRVRRGNPLLDEVLYDATLTLTQNDGGTHSGITVSHPVHGSFPGYDTIIFTRCENAPSVGSIDRVRISGASAGGQPPVPLVLTSTSMVHSSDFLHALGNARLVLGDGTCDDGNSIDDPELWVANLGLYGHDGVAIDLRSHAWIDDDCDGADLDVATTSRVAIRRPVSGNNPDNYCALVVGDSGGIPGSVLSTLESVVLAGHRYISLEVPEFTAPVLRVHVLDENGALVLSLNGLPPGEPVIDMVASTLNFSKIEWDYKPQSSSRGSIGDVMRFRLLWDSPQLFAVDEHPPVLGKEIRIAARDTAGNALIPHTMKILAAPAASYTTITCKLGRIELARLRPFCPEDCVPLNPDGSIGDGHVSIADISFVLTSFGSAGGRCDVSPNNGDGTWGDGSISIADITSVLSAFGPCP